MAKVSHKALFEKLRDTTVIANNEQYARWTLPKLMADLYATRGSSTRAVVERDYQEMGAILVNHLASKLARLLFPAQFPFFKVELSAELKKMAGEKGVDESALNDGVSRVEVQANRRLFMNAAYAQLTIALAHLIVTGNVLLHRDSKGGTCTAYGLQTYVTRRDGKGNCLDTVLRETTYVEALAPDIQNALKRADKTKYSRPEAQVDMFTRIHRQYRGQEIGYEVTQEVDTIPVGEPSWYPQHLCPWFAATWSLLAGEHYGRGLVEDYAGGFACLSDASEAAALYGIEMMRVVHLVSAASGTDIDDFAMAENGEYLRGDPNSVAAHESGDGAKLQQILGMIDGKYQRLAKAFMYQANVRDAERVTAYELQMEAQEAENSLGGAYSVLSHQVQIPLANILITEVSKEALAAFISGDMRVDVIAGIPALGRASDVQNLTIATQEATAILPMAQVDKRIDPQRLVDMVLRGRSIDKNEIMYTPEEQKANADAEAQALAGQQQMQAAATMADTAETLGGMEGV